MFLETATNSKCFMVNPLVAGHSTHQLWQAEMLLTRDFGTECINIGVPQISDEARDWTWMKMCSSCWLIDVQLMNRWVCPKVGDSFPFNNKANDVKIIGFWGYLVSLVILSRSNDVSGCASLEQSLNGSTVQESLWLIIASCPFQSRWIMTTSLFSVTGNIGEY